MYAGTKTLFASACAIFAAALAAEAPAPNVGLGQQLYLDKCAACHGATGKGGGSLTESLLRSVPDLTTYARRHGGELPKGLMARTIDGRPADDTAHGCREMASWGMRLQKEALAAGRAPEPYIDSRITALVDYLATIQVK